MSIGLFGLRNLGSRSAVLNRYFLWGFVVTLKDQAIFEKSAVFLGFLDQKSSICDFLVKFCVLDKLNTCCDTMGRQAQ